MSVRTREEGEALIVAAASRNAHSHPRLGPDEPWMRLDSGDFTHFQREDLGLSDFPAIREHLISIRDRIEARSA